MKWLPWTMAAMWLVARYSVRQFVGMSVENAHTFGVLSNVLLIVILVFVAIYHVYKTSPARPRSFFDDFKLYGSSQVHTVAVDNFKFRFRFFLR